MEDFQGQATVEKVTGAKSQQLLQLPVLPRIGRNVLDWFLNVTAVTPPVFRVHRYQHPHRRKMYDWQALTTPRKLRMRRDQA
jgi:hypothetical protein